MRLPFLPGRSRDAALTFFGIALLVAIAGVGFPSAQAGSVTLHVDLPDRPGAGAKVFQQKNCSRCHALGGRGMAVGPDLGQVGFLGDVLQLAGAFWNHAPVMQQKMTELKISRPVLSTGEAADLVAFLTAYRYYDTLIREAGNPALGRIVFVRKGCAGCHEGTAGRAATAPDLGKYLNGLTPIAIAQAMWAHSPAMTQSMEAAGTPWPTFAGREMTDLTAYLQAGLGTRAWDPGVFELGSPRLGWTLFQSKGCSTCHGVAGVGGTDAPDLGDRGRAMVRSVPEIAGMMWNHSQKMNAEFVRRGMTRATFAGQEMADLISYLYFVNYATERGVPSRGAQLFVETCSSCHAFGKAGTGPDLLAAPGLDTPLGIVAAMWNHATGMQRQAERIHVPWPHLERGDAADLAAFIITRRATKP